MGGGLSGKEQGTWESLKQLQVGQKIEVIEMNLKSLKGTLTAVSEEAISLRTKQGEVSVERANVFRVSDREHTRRGRNALIGAAIGGGVGVGLGVPADAICRNESSDCYLTPIWGGIGAGIGAGLGAASPGYHTIYRAKKVKARKSH